MNKKTMKKLTGLILIIFSAVSITSAQERNDVIKVYNEGAKLLQTDVQGAITAFENVVTLSDQVGESVNDLKTKAVQVLPGLYVRAANNAIKENKPTAEIIRAAKIAAAASEKYNNTAGKDNASKIMVQAYNKMGTELFTDKEYDKALLAFDSLLAISPDYSNAIFNKALIYRAQNNAAAFEESIDLFLGKLEAGKDDQISKQASTLALEYFRAAGSQASQAENLDEALELLNKAAKYGEDKDLFYFFADVYNKKKSFDSGIEYAQKGLALETGEADAKAKFYFQLGLGQEGKGQTAEACASFKSAMFGPFAEPSKAKRTNLKCQ